MVYHAKHGKGEKEENGRHKKRLGEVFHKAKKKGFDARRAVGYDETLDSGTLDDLENIRAHEDALSSDCSGEAAEITSRSKSKDDDYPQETGVC